MILEKTALSTAYFMVVPVRKHWPSQLQKGECILLRKLLQFLLLESYGWIVYIWSSSTSLQSLTCLGHLGKKHAVNLYTSPCFRGLCVFSSKFSGSECEKNMNLFRIRRAHLYAVMMKQIDLPIQVLENVCNSQTSRKWRIPRPKSFVVAGIFSWDPPKFYTAKRMRSKSPMFLSLRKCLDFQSSTMFLLKSYKNHKSW